jgi:D-lactate dehydrogenase
MKIGVFEAKGWQQKYLQERLKKHKLIFVKSEINKRNVEKVKDCEGLIVFIGSKIDKEILSKLPKLKFVTTMSTGFDHIDVQECKRRGVKASNVPFYGENTVAEHTFALILALSRNVHKGIERTKKNDFSLEGLKGFDLKDKTLGVIGPGHIGQNVIRMALGFDMNVIAYGVEKDKELARRVGFKFVDLDKLFKESDIITIHVPLNPGTEHLIDKKAIRKMKKGVFIINTARGGIIDTTALLTGLDTGRVAGAALDVLEGEEDIKHEEELLKQDLSSREMKILIENHVLLKEKNVIVTPHMAFFTKEALERILDTTIENVNALSRNKTKNSVLK